MKLIELIEKIKEREIEQLLIDNLVDIEYDLIDVYAKDKLDFGSEIQFFNAEEISNEIFMNVDGINYVNVCPLNLLEDIISDFLSQDSEIDSFDLTYKVLSYLENDA